MPTHSIPDGLAILKTLRPKQQRFCREYIVDFNGRQAAVRAGYAAHAAHVQASQLLSKLNIQSAIRTLASRQVEKMELTQDRVMQEVARLAFSDPRKLFDEDGRLKKPKDWDDHTAAAVRSVDMRKREVSTWSKTEALNLSARLLKLVNADDPPMLQQNFLMVAPPASTPEDWAALAQGQPTLIPMKTPHVHGNGNGDGA